MHEKMIRSFSYEANGERKQRYVMELFNDTDRQLLHCIDLDVLTKAEMFLLIRASMNRREETPREFYETFVRTFISYTRSYRTFRTDRIEA